MTLWKLVLVLCSLSSPNTCETVESVRDGNQTACWLAAPQVAAEHPDKSIREMRCERP